MKFKKLVEKISDIDYSVIDHRIAQAVRFHDKKVSAYEDACKKLKLEIPTDERDAHQDVVSNPQLKKLHLSESLFESLLTEANHDRPVSTELLDLIDSEILDCRSVLNACLKYMSEDAIADMAKSNNFISDIDNEELLEEDFDGFMFQGPTGVRFNRENLSGLSETVQVVIPEVTVNYQVREGVLYKDKTMHRDSLAKLELTSESRDLLESVYKKAVREKLSDYNVEINGSALVAIPSPISIISKTSLTEGIDSNTSHADDFIKALRAAGFGDGFDQKLIIDEYSTGTRVEYKDQGGHFVVTILEDKVTLEGQDEGEKPFKKDFTTWSDFVKEFEALYPGVPVHESNNTLNEARKLPAMINNYEREDGAKYYVYAKREPLAYVIEAELTSGEICYLDKNGKVTQSVMPHKDYPVSQVSVQWDEWEMPYIKVWGPSKRYFEKAIEVAKKYGKDYEIHEEKYVKGPRKYWLEIIVNDEDTEEPYVDPDAPVFSSNKVEIDDEDSETNLDESISLKENCDLVEDCIPEGLEEYFYVNEDDDTNPQEYMPSSYVGYEAVANLRGNELMLDNGCGYALLIKDPEGNYFVGIEHDGYLKSITREDIDDLLDDLNDGMTGRHIKDNEDLEDSQRYPIESPAPAQTGLLFENESKLEEDVMMNGALNEVRISTEGIRNFRPWGTAVQTFNNILEAGKMDEFEKNLELEHENGIGATELNDILTYNTQEIYKELGMIDYLDEE